MTLGMANRLWSKSAKTHACTVASFVACVMHVVVTLMPYWRHYSIDLTSSLTVELRSGVITLFYTQSTTAVQRAEQSRLTVKDYGIFSRHAQFDFSSTLSANGDYEFVFPAWHAMGFVCVLTFAVMFIRSVRTYRRKSASSRNCGSCGYPVDCKATACPECGCRPVPESDLPPRS